MGKGEICKAKRAAEILGKNRQGLDRIAQALIEKEEITGEEVRELMD